MTSARSASEQKLTGNAMLKSASLIMLGGLLMIAGLVIRTVDAYPEWGFILAAGRLESGPHNEYYFPAVARQTDGAFVLVPGISLKVAPGSLPHVILKQFHGQRVELVIRLIPPRPKELK